MSQHASKALQHALDAADWTSTWVMNSALWVPRLSSKVPGVEAHAGEVTAGRVTAWCLLCIRQARRQKPSRAPCSGKLRDKSDEYLLIQWASSIANSVRLSDLYMPCRTELNLQSKKTVEVVQT